MFVRLIEILPPVNKKSGIMVDELHSHLKAPARIKNKHTVNGKICISSYMFVSLLLSISNNIRHPNTNTQALFYTKVCPTRDITCIGMEFCFKTFNKTPNPIKDFLVSPNKGLHIKISEDVK